MDRSTDPLSHPEPAWGGRARGETALGKPPPVWPPPPGPPHRARRAAAWPLLVALLAGLLGGLVGTALAPRRPAEPAPAPAPLPAAPQLSVSSRAAVDRVQAVASALLPVVVQIETDGAAGATGSGVIMRPDGYILTNNHVVAGAGRIGVTLPNAEPLRARLVGRDASSDLAVVKVERAGLPVARFGRSADLEVGELAVAVGSPFGFRGSVTAGIVSALHRVVEVPGDPDGQAEELVNAIQTDAAINPGNSGGALANRAGQVVGINTAIATNGQREGNAGVGFAIPIDEALHIARQLIDGHKVRVPFLGVEGGADLTAEVAERYGLRGRTGALVRRVLTGGPAVRAGVKPGDLVVKVAGSTVQGWDELKVAVRKVQVGQTVPIVVVRDGRELTLEITPADQPAR